MVVNKPYRWKRVRDLLNSGRRMNVWLLGDTLNISKTVVHRVDINELNMQKVCPQLVPKLSTDQ